MTATPAGPPRSPATGRREEIRGETGAPPPRANHDVRTGPPAGGGPTTRGSARDGHSQRTGRTCRCQAKQSPSPDWARSANPGRLKAVVVADVVACRWCRPFALGEQGPDWLRATGRADRYLDDCRNWPKSTDCPAKIRETAANPRPQDVDPNFGSLN